jgi:hypothetical protein
MMSDEDKDSSELEPTGEPESDELAPPGEYYEEPRRFDRILDYIETKKGDVMLGRIVAMLEQLAPSAKTFLDALAKVKKENPDIEYRKWRVLMILRFAVVVIALATVVYMAYTNTLNSTTSLLVAGIVAGFLSYSWNQK